MGMKVVPPDGGYGWAVLFAAVMINMLLPGSVKSFGVLYVEFLKVLSATPTEASWIPALCYFLYNSLGPVSSMLSSKFSYRLVAIVGCIVSSAGLMLSYFADSVAYLYVSYGVMMGIGCGLSFPVTIYIVCEYFEKRRGFATGLCICGSAIGTIILPPLLQFLLNRLGHKFAVLILGGVLTSTIFCAFLFEPVEKHTKLVAFDDEESDESAKAGKESAGLYDTSRRGSIATVESLTLDPRRISVSLQQVHLRQSFLDKQSQLPKSLAVAESQQIEPKPQLSVVVVDQGHQGHQEAAQAEATAAPSEDRAKSSLFDLAILKDPLYLVILISNSAAGISNTNFMILLPAYAVAEGHSQESAALLLSIVSALDLIGRVGGASLSDTSLLPKHYYFVAGLALSGLALVLLPLLNGAYLYLACLVAVCGLASGLYIGTTAVIMADMLGPERLASSYGISLFVNGILQLAGPPICNAAFERIGSYRPIFLTLGMIVLCGTTLWAFLPILTRRKNSDKHLATTRACKLEPPDNDT
ncbi:monocarboxylate transporter 9-like isoform X2 [Trichogramma pretiosum]|uniref:monocarboxylate transporter 9-like isoform X2 n=1 Tax=Trichogramma pretiosum TaxID=7493 RepID=UPI0006C99AF0|nr:monocarboxylate transporter 9-like isoform X2 [Trichogramma pretiosum]